MLKLTLHENPLMALDQISWDLRQQLLDKPGIKRIILTQTLDGMLMTLKLAEDTPDAQNLECCMITPIMHNGSK